MRVRFGIKFLLGLVLGAALILGFHASYWHVALGTRSEG